MFFIRTGLLAAWCITILSAIKTALGFVIAITLDDSAMVAAARRYFNAANSGEIIGEGIYGLGIGISLGLLAVIAKGVTNRL